MSKFKVGDKVRCMRESAAVGVQVGKVYTVKGYNTHCRKFGWVLLVEVDSSPFEACFELVEHNPVLTPEEVFEHLRKGTKLQFQNSYSGHWYDVIAPQYVSYEEITTKQWRIKPEPKVIELNGKKYQEIME